MILLFHILGMLSVVTGDGFLVTEIGDKLAGTLALGKAAILTG